MNLLELFQNIVPVFNFDASQVIMAIIVGIGSWLLSRAVRNIDKNIDTVHEDLMVFKSDSKMETDKLHDRITGVKDALTLEIIRVKDKTSDQITAVRLDLEDKMEIHDSRIRSLETRKD